VPNEGLSSAEDGVKDKAPPCRFGTGALTPGKRPVQLRDRLGAIEIGSKAPRSCEIRIFTVTEINPAAES
jgi:hypothetical protein